MNEETKTFTQEEVNTIVQDRIAKEKAKYEKQIQEMQADIARREKRNEAADLLRQKGLSAELIDLVRLDDDEAFNKSISLLEKTCKNQQKPEAGNEEGHKVPGATKMVGMTPPMAGKLQNDPVRAAMGLNR